jgi:hypothetical protein
MANDSTNAGQVASEQDATPINDGYFTDMQGEEAYFGPEQLAQAAAGGAPVQVPVPADQNVIRVQVTPGEILELSSPFDPDAALLGREENGNLAIKVGDVTVILLGYVEANSTAPVVVETSDGQPIDVATLLASTDPSIDIQTAAGPAAGAQGQGADNTGAILALLQGGAGLSGLNAVGAQDATQLSYGLIDNAIKLDREDALLTTAATPFRGLAEPFLRDPFNNTTFSDFSSFFTNYKTDVNTNPGSAWADFTGTTANDTDFDAYLQQTSFTNLVTHTSTTDEPLYIDTDALALQIAGMTSDQSHLYIDPATVDLQGHATTVFVRRESDDALILVIHAHEAGNGLSDDTTYSSGDYQIDSYLINRLDHPDQGQDILNLDIPYVVRDLGSGSEQEEITFTTGTVEVQIQDDVPITGETDYYNFLHASSCKDALDCFSALLGGKITDYVVTNDAGHVDEDYIFHGNHDKDNAAGPDSDADRGDDIGDKFVVGMLNINFGADGPSGKIPEGDKHTKTNPLFHDADPQALAIAGLKVGDPYPDATSHGHDLVVLKHEKLPFPFSTVEMVQVGYHPDVETPSGESLAKTSAGYGDTVVFTLLLQTGPNLPLFGGFVFEQCAPLDHAVAATLESNLPLNFQIIATDDDGDHPVDPVTIHIVVNDDAPTIQITYKNEDPRNCVQDDEGSEDIGTFGVSGDVHVGHYTTTDFGHVDEDWLDNGLRKEALVFAGGQGNHDQDAFGNDNANLYGDDKGGLEVCGQIKVKYGADGPSDTADNGLALKSYTIADPFNPPPYENGDGSHLTSGGKTLVVLESDPGHLLVGFAGALYTGEGGIPVIVPGVKIFELTLDQDTGKFDFKLWGAIDHVPTTNPDNGDPETNLVLSFNVGTVEDFDGDKAIGAINIKVNDDHPEVGVTYCNELPGIGYGDGLQKQSDTDFGRIDEDWLQGAGGNSESPTLVNIGNQDQDYFGSSNANQFGDDYGSDHLSGQIHMKYGADGPGTQTIGLEILSGAFKDADGNALSSGGNALTVLHSDAGLLTIGYGTTTVLTLTLDDTGHFDFKQSKPLDHPIHSVIEDNINLAFNAGSITDADHDTVAAVIKIQVNDDVPETGITYTDGGTPEVEPDTFITYGAPVNHFGQVDEDYLATGNLDADNSTPGDESDPARGDTEGRLIVTGDLSGTKYGADGPDGSPGKTFFLTELNEGDAFNDADGNQLKSHGNLLVVLDSDGTTLNVGYGTTVVFTLTMTSTNEFQFELKGPLDDTPKEGGKIEDGLVLAFGAANEGAPTDKDGDPAARIIIHVNDDAPRGCDVTYTSYSGPDDTAIPGTSPAATAGVVDEAWANNANGNQENDTKSGDEPGYSHAVATITCDFGADGPAAGGGFALDHYTVGDAFVDANGQSFTSGGETLVVQIASATQLIVGLSGLGATFTVDVASTGAVGFHLYGALDHPLGDDVETDLPVVLNVTATDFDGDSVGTQVTFKVNDDAPLEGTVTYSSGEGDAGLIDEDFVSGGNSDNDGTASDTDQSGGASVSGTVAVAFGADGPAAHPYALQTYSAGGIYIDANGGMFTGQFDPINLVVLSSSATQLVVGHSIAGGSGTVFTVTLDQDTGDYSVTFSEGLDSVSGDQVEDSVAVAIAVVATDYDGDSSTTKIEIKVNDDRPVAVADTDLDSAYQGNVLANDTKGADDAKVTGASSTTGGDQSADINGDTTVVGALGLLIVHANGGWTYTANPGTEGGEDEFTYTVKDGDGDTATATLTITVAEDDSDSLRLASVAVGPTHEPAPHYDHEVTVAGLNGVVLNGKDTSTYHFEDATGGHIISGGAGNDYIHVTGATGAILSGNGGDDIIHGGDGASILKGGAGDDTLFGGAGADSFFGDAGHDAMSGGGGNDTFYKVDADDLDGTTNTLDGTHSIDGGTGTDTVDLSVLQTFDSKQALHLENVEALSFEGKTSGGGGTAATLNYDAAYGITEVGGLHQLTVSGDTKDTLNLQQSSGHLWSEIGNTHVYEAGAGASKVTVTVDHDVAVQLS